LNFDIDYIFLLKKNDFSDFNENINKFNTQSNIVKAIFFTKFDILISIFLGLFILRISPRFSTRISLKLLYLIKYNNFYKKYESVWYEFSQTFWLVKYINTSKEAILSCQDIQTQLISTKSFLENILFSGFTFITEKKLFNLTDKIICYSNNDYLLIKNYFKINKNKIIYQIPKLSNFIKNVSRKKNIIEKYSILFWGALSRIENHQAIENFLNTSFKEILNKNPLAKIYIVGSDPNKRLLSYQSENIIITGYIEDPSEYFSKVSIGIAPLEQGAGIKIKVLEMLACGITVIGTPIAAEGIEDSNNLIICSVDEFSNQINNFFINESV